MRLCPDAITPRIVADHLVEHGCDPRDLEDDRRLGDAIIRLANRLDWRLSRVTTNFDAIRYSYLMRRLGGPAVAA